MTEQFAFSAEERAAVREAVKAAVTALVTYLGVPNPVTSGVDLAWDADVDAIEAAINRARAGEPLLTIRATGKGKAAKAAIRYETGWKVCYYDGSGLAYQDGEHDETVPDFQSWPVVYRPEAEA